MKKTGSVLFLLILLSPIALFPVYRGFGDNQISILIDEVHSYWVTSTIWSDFVGELTSLGYDVQSFTSGELTSAVLLGYDVLVIGSAWGDFTQGELDVVEDYVLAGGGLFLLGVGWSWVDYHPGSTIENYPMNKIACKFGFVFNDDIIFDDTDNTGDPGNPIFTRLLPHTIALGVDVIGMPRGNPCSISADEAQLVVTGDEDSYSGYHDPVYQSGDYPPVLVSTLYGSGRVVGLGNEGFFTSVDDDNDGIINLYEYDNLLLGLNIIDWLAHARICSVWTTDSDGDPKVKFDPGETVYIHWKADDIVSYMVITAPGGVSGYVNLPSSGRILYDPPFGSGIYEIKCREGEPIWIAIGTFFVIPELPFYGSLLTLATMLGALFTMRKRRIQ